MKYTSTLVCCLFFFTTIYFYVTKTRQNNRPTLQFNADALKKAMRQISFKNNRETPIKLSLTLRDSQGNKLDEHSHILDAQEAGWVPYFVPGTLAITYDDKTIELDITQENKEYVIIVTATGELTTTIQDIVD